MNADIADWDFKPTKGTYNIGDSVPFTGIFKYKGIAQYGYLRISLGTGIYPSFITKYIFLGFPVSFSQSIDWKEISLSGSFTLPSGLEPGQTYSVRAQLETSTDYTQETDTDWGVITIYGAVEPEFSQFVIDFNKTVKV